MIYTLPRPGRNTGKPGVFRKTKIGQVVKGIPKVWIEKQDDEFYNRILLNKYPYFFKYRYKGAHDDYKKYEEECNSECKYRFRMPLADLLRMENHTQDQKAFLNNYYKYMPLVYSDSPMNHLCRYIEKVDFGIREKIRGDGNFDYRILIDKDHPYTEEEYAAVIKIFGEYNVIAKAMAIRKESAAAVDDPDYSTYNRYRVFCESCLEEMSSSLCDMILVTNCLVRHFYEEKPRSSKELLWSIAGPYLYGTICKNVGKRTIFYPFIDPDGDITYLNKHYTMREVALDDPEPV